MTEWIFWAGTVGYTVPPLERLVAAQAVGARRFAVSQLDVEWALANELDAVELGRRIRDAGCDVIMDPVFNWYGGLPASTSRFGRFTADETIRMSADLGAVDLNFVGQPTHDLSLDQLVTAFSAMADRAADIGARACLEFTPISAIVGLSDGWDIVRTAGHPNGGLLVDTWHFHRSNSSLELLETVPGDRVFSVQVSDARPETTDDVRADTVRRLLPGDGVIDLSAILGVLHRIGGLSWVGPEVISADLAALGVMAAGRLAHDRTVACVAVAGASAAG